MTHAPNSIIQDDQDDAEELAAHRIRLAAPKMLEALEEMCVEPDLEQSFDEEPPDGKVPWVCRHCGTYSESDDELNPGPCQVWDCPGKNARAAIAQAKGE